MKQMKLQMKVSIASADWSYQPNQVVLIEEKLARLWIKAGHAVLVNGELPITDFNVGLADLDAAEALRRRCVHCERRAAMVYQNKPFCLAHYRAECGS